MLLILDAQFFFVSSSFNGNLPNQFLPTTKPKKGRHKGHGQKVLSFALRRHKVLPPNPPFVFFFSFFFFRTPRTTTTVVSCVVSDTFWTLVARDDALSFSLSLGVPFLSRSRAKGAKNARARALNRTRRAGESLAPVGASELARARGEKPSPEFCVRANPKERVCWFPQVVAQKRRGKERKGFL